MAIVQILINTDEALVEYSSDDLADALDWLGNFVAETSQAGTNATGDVDVHISQVNIKEV